VASRVVVVLFSLCRYRRAATIAICGGLQGFNFANGEFFHCYLSFRKLNTFCCRASHYGGVGKLETNLDIFFRVQKWNFSAILGIQESYDPLDVLMTF
jgi:hypothetical protein